MLQSCTIDVSECHSASWGAVLDVQTQELMASLPASLELLQLSYVDVGIFQARFPGAGCLMITQSADVKLPYAVMWLAEAPYCFMRYRLGLQAMRLTHLACS